MELRPIRIDGDVAFVPLTRGYEAIIDAADVPLVDGFNWSARVQTCSVYAGRTDQSSPTRGTVRMHRFLMGEPKGFEVDHRDGNGLNNRRDNLRVATGQQNRQNTRTRCDNSSGFKGVAWHKNRGKWLAHIGVGGRRLHLGYFETPEDAHAAYCNASTRLHGDFGRAA